MRGRRNDMGILCAKCPSFAMNDDPDEILCDRCWRAAKIEVLKKRLLKMEELLLKAIAEYEGMG
jgi:hypothetical protein